MSPPLGNSCSQVRFEPRDDMTLILQIIPISNPLLSSFSL